MRDEEENLCVCQENIFTDVTCFIGFHFSLAQLADKDESFVYSFEERRSALSARISPASSLADTV